jgi:phosphate transport system substrate-binding protein
MRDKAMTTDGLKKKLAQVCLGLGLLLAYSYQAFATKNMLEPQIYQGTRQKVLAPYESLPDAFGNIELAVTDTSFPIAERFAKSLQKYQPGLNINLRSAPLTVLEHLWRKEPVSHAALLFTPMSKQETIDFTKTRGYQPTMLRIASDAITVIVNWHNPISHREVLLAELDAIFSEKKLRGHSRIHSWGQLGLTTFWQKRPVEAVAQVSNQSVSGYFRRVVLENSDYRRDIPYLDSSAQVIRRVSESVSAIGYIRSSQLNKTVKALTLTGRDEKYYINPAMSKIPITEDPLEFWLYLYLDHKPGFPLAMTMRALLRFCYSQEGQDILSDAGYMRVNKRIVTEDINKYGHAWP